MKVIFGTTNRRKVDDFQNIINELSLDIEILALADIGWNRGEIEETGTTLEDNSLIKANAIRAFCLEKGINCLIVTDDAGLFCEALNNEPGVYTGRYADEELKMDPTLPKHQCVFKLLTKLENEENRNAKYRCVVTCMQIDGSYYQESGETLGVIAKSIIGKLNKPFFYSIFVPEGSNEAFSDLNKDELQHTYRYKALRKSLTKISGNL